MASHSPPIIHFDHATFGFPGVVALEDISLEIQSGEFAKAWIAENKSGRHKFLAMREAAQHQKVEVVGAELRKMMPFLKKKKDVGVPAAT